MPEARWQIRGDYFETCSCDYLCPCIITNMAARPTHGHCHAPLVFHINEGRHDQTRLDDLTFIVALSAPGPMIEGNWTVGLILDERATPDQRNALTAIGSGQAGGPLAGLLPLIGTFAGVEVRPIEFKKRGQTCSVRVAGLLDQAVEGVAGVANPDEPLVIDNTLHPANARLALAKSTRSHLHAFGIHWDDAGGRNNGHFAPFEWKVD